MFYLLVLLTSYSCECSGTRKYEFNQQPRWEIFIKNIKILQQDSIVERIL